SPPSCEITVLMRATDPSLEGADLTPRRGAGKDYERAVQYYSEAIALCPTNAIYYGNRSLAHLRAESYGYALADATRALELDGAYVKGYYRRAASNMALGKFKAALVSLQLCWGTKRHLQGCQ
uniref:Uncharacterized protein n=1 Tax=Apteryx owenii TaxID=8824 RepID=A0A8B9Q3N5_APTOW